ncbi:MAG: response regulator [Candidatus Omnitrophica bacterium]|nr:response regulator [Candidatus Omnitrophota bacterium]
MAKEETAGHVLLVDDDEAIRESLGELMEACGYTVQRADCVKNAIKVLEAHDEIEVITSDMKMPGESGMSVLSYLSEKGLTIPLIFLTGYGTLDTCQEAVKLGAFDYILKPIDDKDRIMIPLAHAVEKRRMELKTIELQRDIIQMAEEHQAIIDELLMDTEMKDKVHDKISQILNKWDTKKK